MFLTQFVEQNESSFQIFSWRKSKIQQLVLFTRFAFQQKQLRLLKNKEFFNNR